MSFSATTRVRLSAIHRLPLLAAAVVLTFATAPPAQAGYRITQDSRSLTSITEDGFCNLTEAIASVNIGGPINTDCLFALDDNDDNILHLEGAGPSFVYELASGTTINVSDVFLSTDSESAVVVQSPGTVLTINAGASLTLQDVIVKHKAGTSGRAVTNHGTLTAYFSTFQDGDVSTRTGDAGNGGGIFNDGTIEHLNYSVVQNNKATNGSGGGIYSIGIINEINASVINNNVAAQGGGIYATRTATDQKNLQLDSTTISGNRAVAVEVTSGGSTSGTGTPCSSTESSTMAFDNALGTKWCTTTSSAPSSSAPVVLRYQFASGTTQRVGAYSVTSANDVQSRDPMDWTFEGSNSTSGPWTVLHSVSGETFNSSSPTIPSQSRFLTKTYFFTNATAFGLYRLRVTRNRGGGTRTQLAELQLYQDQKTGDGGGLHYSCHTTGVENNTISGNIAGCTSASCACTSAFCATSSNTSASSGRGGGIFASAVFNDVSFVGPETFAHYNTIAGNSASQGGGFYQGYSPHWDWLHSIFGQNTARTSSNPEPDFHGFPHTGTFSGGIGGTLFSNAAGIVVTNDGRTGLITTGEDPDQIGPPMLDPLADNGGGVGPLKQTHALRSGSAARDAVPATSFGPDTDQRGFPRPGSGSPLLDRGAFEVQ